MAQNFRILPAQIIAYSAFFWKKGLEFCFYIFWEIFFTYKLFELAHSKKSSLIFQLFFCGRWLKCCRGKNYLEAPS
jgi:hypothetical protein